MTAELFLPAVVVVITGIFGLWNARTNKVGTRENLLIDQLQEDRDKDRKRLDELDNKVQILEREISRLLSRDTLWQIHAGRQDAEIIRLGGEPLPRPEGLKIRDID